MTSLLAAGVAVALLVYGIAGVLVQMLGASHFHRAAAAAVVIVPLQDFRRPSGSTARHEHGLFGHAHASLRRHVHDASGPDLVKVGADDAADDGASSGAACQVALLRDRVTCAVAGAISLRWPSVASSVALVGVDRIERPLRV